MNLSELMGTLPITRMNAKDLKELISPQDEIFLTSDYVTGIGKVGQIKGNTLVIEPIPKTSDGLEMLGERFELTTLIPIPSIQIIYIIQPHIQDEKNCTPTTSTKTRSRRKSPQ